MTPYSILLIEDQTLVRMSLAQLINHTGDFRIDSAVPSISDALDRLRHPPAIDLIVCDFHLKGETAQDLFRQSPSPLPPVIILTSLFNAIEIPACLKLGARGFLFKESELEDILRAFEDVLAGGVYFSLQTGEAPDSSLDTAQNKLKLTPSEQEILRWLSTGMSNKQIATTLDKSMETVKVQVAGIMRKLQVHNRTQAAVKATWLNLI